MRSPWTVGLCLIAAGCNSAPPIHTPSGQPEVTLNNVDATCVKSGFMNALVNDGWSIKTTTDTQIVAGKPSTNFAANLLLSTQAGGNPEERATVLFIPLTDNGMRIVMSEAYVSNPATAFEKTSPITQTQPTQDQFSNTETRIQATCGKHA